MSLMVPLLVVLLVTECWSAPPPLQRRNWTPQAILYLKGAQRHRSVLERTSREGGDTSAVSQNQSSSRPGSSLSSVLLELLERVMDEGGRNPDDYTYEKQLHLNYV